MMKRILIIIGCVIVAAITGFFFFVAHGVRRLAEEDRVPHLYYPVVDAIYGYCDTNHIAPEHLEKLIPDFLEALPSNRPNDIVSYARMSDGTNWMLCVTADLKTRKARWMYFYGSAPELEPAGAMTRIGRIHTWYIYKESTQAQPGGAANPHSPSAQGAAGR